MSALAEVVLLVGSLLVLLAGVGLYRFPDVLSRMHAATKATTLGLALVMVGTGLSLRDAGSIVRVLLVVVLQLLTAPVAAHLVGRAVAVRRSPAPPQGGQQRS